LARLAASGSDRAELRRHSAEEFAVGHPQAPSCNGRLSELGAPIETYTAAATEFRVQLDTPRGTVSL
jgi:hypothetical protein